jgi:alkylation response protein AidB-like acyl-CoA dehydrogenase
LGIVTETEVIIEIAKSFGSMAWVSGFLMSHALFLGHFPEQAQIDVWESTGPDAKIVSALAPVGVVEPATGGWRVSGRWAWSSGAGHADWIILNAMFPTTDGGIEPRWFIVPSEDFGIIDTWHSSGLTATGSDDVTVDGVFVPEHRTTSLTPLREGTSPGRELHGGIWTKPLLSFGGLEQSAPTIGLARGALEVWTEHIRTKAHTYTQEQVARSVPNQLALADATVKVDCAELLLMQRLELVDSDAEITIDDRIRSRLAISHVPQLTLRALDELMQFAGASALRTDSPLQRAWRDIRACSMHILCDYTAAGQNFSRRSMGIPLDPLNAMF